VLDDVLDGVRVGVDLLLVALDLDQLLVDRKGVVLDFTSKVIDLVLQPLPHGPLADFDVHDLVFDLVELGLAAGSLLLVDGHLEQVDPVFELLILFFQLKDHFSVFLALVQHGIQKLSHQSTDLRLEVHEIQIPLQVCS